MDKTMNADKQEIYKNLKIIIQFMINTTTPSAELVFLMSAMTEVESAYLAHKRSKFH